MGKACRLCARDGRASSTSPNSPVSHRQTRARFTRREVRRECADGERAWRVIRIRPLSDPRACRAGESPRGARAVMDSVAHRRPSLTGRDAANDHPGEGRATAFGARGFGDGKPAGHGLSDADSLYPRLHYTHGVPKTSETIGKRISLACRMKADRQLPELPRAPGLSTSVSASGSRSVGGRPTMGRGPLHAARYNYSLLPWRLLTFPSASMAPSPVSTGWPVRFAMRVA